MAERAATVEASHVGIRRGGLDVIVDATFAVGPGLWRLHGPNGSGKSTLLRALAGVGARWRGTVRIAGHDLDREPVAARRCLGYAPQSADLFGFLRVREFLETVAALRGADPEVPLAQARRWIHDGCAEQRIDTLSAGQRRKLGVCAALTGLPPVLLLDEPEAGLDAASVEELRGVLRSLAACGHVIVWVSHTQSAGDMDGAGVLLVRDGRVHVDTAGGS